MSSRTLICFLSCCKANIIYKVSALKSQTKVFSKKMANFQLRMPNYNKKKFNCSCKIMRYNKSGNKKFIHKSFINLLIDCLNQVTVQSVSNQTSSYHHPGSHSSCPYILIGCLSSSSCV